MEAKEMVEKFNDFYGIMKASKNVCNMKLFGDVMHEMFAWFAENKPELAEGWLSKLESIKWHNYLTAKEADKIIEAMNPKSAWDKEQVMEGLQKLELPTEEAPYFNGNALYVTMSMIYSDSAKTIASIIGKPLAEIDDDTMMKAVYSLAMDKLKDKDGKFSVRYYFGL